VAIIHLGRRSPDGSSDLPGNAALAEAEAMGGQPLSISLFGLAPRGVCLAGTCCHARRWALTSPFHPSPFSGLVCFLLHLSSHKESLMRPDVIRLAALRCSDFPPFP